MSARDVSHHDLRSAHAIWSGMSNRELCLSSFRSHTVVGGCFQPAKTMSAAVCCCSPLQGVDAVNKALVYQCKSLATAAVAATAEIESGVAPSALDTSIDIAKAFSLSSRPSATKKIYLDFNGHNTTSEHAASFPQQLATLRRMTATSTPLWSPALAMQAWGLLRCIAAACSWQMQLFKAEVKQW